MSGRPVWAEVDLSAIRRNTATLKSRLNTDVALCAVVKANGYGHGAVEVARTALEAGAEYLGVAMLDEALALRHAGLKSPILVFGYTPPEESREVAEGNIEQTVFTLEQAKSLSAAGEAIGRRVPVHLKIDTGMGRLGVSPELAGEFSAAVAAMPGVKIHGVYTHFSDADGRESEYTLWQLDRFLLAVRGSYAAGASDSIRHAGNSAALLRYPEAHFDMVRAGIMLYGYWPSAEMERTVDLVPAMSLKTRIVFLKRVGGGTSVSYGRRHVTTGEAVIGTLPLGYADGYSRRLSGLAEVVVRGVRVPVIGNICMDQCMIDVSGVAGVCEGDEVEIFGGGGVGVEEVADWLGTIPYEVLCMIRSRVPRRYLP